MKTIFYFCILNSGKLERLPYCVKLMLSRETVRSNMLEL